MKSKTKTKKSTKAAAKKTIVKRKKEKYYSSSFMFAAIAMLLVVELVAFGGFSAAEWSNGFALLDFSQTTVDTYHGMAYVFEPMITTAYDINEFYQLASIEMMDLLSIEMSVTPIDVIASINNFYELASVEMEKILDLSSNYKTPGQVAGAVLE